MNNKKTYHLLKSSSLLLGLLLLTSCAPKINSVKPNLALSDGGTKVTIKGDNLQEAKLKVDNFPVQPLSQQKKQLVFNAPAHPAGEVELDVSNNDGSASYFPFTYYDQPKPSIERIKPKATDVSGNVPISIIGKNLNHVTLTVGNSQPKVLEHTDTLIRFVAPANAAGISKVSLSSKNGKYKTSADLFYGKVSIVTLKFDDVQDHLLKQQRASKATLDKPSLRKKTLDIYTSRKDEFIKFAEDLGAKVVDAYNEMTTLLVYTASDQTREQLKQAPWFHSIAENTEMDLHLVQSRKLVNHHLLPSSLGLPDPSYQGKGTSVMILDSGVDYRRETFGKCSSAGPNCRVVFAKDFTAFDDGQRDNGNFHGTNVAAIAAGTRGVAPYAKIIAADVVKPNQRISPTDAIAAINWAIQNKEVYNIVALNMSFGGGRFYPAGCEVDSPYGAAIYEARRAGIIPVASAGNENNPNGMKSPACLPDVVSVGAVYDGGSVRPQTCPPPTEEDKLTCFTNTSSLTTMLAPGAEIVAGDTVMSGTSQAAPHTTGAVAALLGKHPELTPDQVSKRLRHTGIPITDPRNSTPYARLDLVALFEGDLNRPRPVEEQHEWFRVNQVNGQKLPLLNDPWLIQSQTRDELVHDKAGGLTWLKPSALPQKLQGEVPLRTAHNFCRRIWDGAGKFRVPTRLELHSLINYKRSGIKVDDSMIEGAQAAEYWTLSPTFDAQSPYSYSNWAIHLEDGRSYSRIVERNKVRFICVSDSPSKPKPPEEHYLNHGDYVEDLATGLFWAKDTTKGSSIHQLADNCNALNHGNMRWRIPSQKELASLLDVTQAAKQPTIDPIFQGELRLQSSTALIDKREFNYHGINFATGYPSKGSASATRCVNQWKNNTSADRIHRGDIYIGGDDYHRSNELYQQLEDAHYKKIEGDLYIETTNLLAIYLPFLEEVTGDIYFNGNKKLETIAFPKLKKVGGSLRIDGNQQLDRIEASRLTEIGGDLYIGRNQSLGKTQDPMDNGTKRKPIDFYQLQSIKGNLDIEINPQLKGFVMQSLIEVGKRLQITQNDSLWTFNFNRLQSIGYLCKDTQDFCGNLGLYLNYRLQYASFPFLSKVLSSFIVQGNQKLEKIGERINTLNLRLDVSGNQALCEIYEIDPIISRMWKLGRHPAGVSVGNNNRETRCLSRCPDLDHCQILSDSN